MSSATSIKTALEGTVALPFKRELSEVIDISRGTVYCIMANVLKMEKDIYYITLIKKLFNAFMSNNFQVKYSL